MKNSEQQRLFNHYNPLEDRLGTDFFDALPKKPGIYKMYGRDGLLLYVGKAKNLRNRLFTYRRAKVGKASRKTIRLIRMVHDIQYELCADEKQALLRENRLIRQKRPEFNHAKKSPETYYFIHVKQEDSHWSFKLNMRQYSEQEWHTYGAFKGHVVVRTALGALFRLLYIAEHKIDSAHHLPSILLKNLTPMNYTVTVSDDHIISIGQLEKFFIGSSDVLFETMLSHFREQELLDKYIGKLLLEDFDALKRFYENCCRRNHQIVQHLDLDTHIIPQQKLDDYLIEMALD